jgi:outer membrane receptor protein involved in Fe transport
LLSVACHPAAFVDTSRATWSSIPASPVTTFSITDNGEEDVATESGSISLTSGLSTRLISHLRAQFSRDLQESTSHSSDVRTRINNVLDSFGRSSILPRQTREHRAHLTETLSFDTSRHSWKFGGDALLTWVYNFFPSMFGGEYFFYNLSVDPWTFEPMRYGMQTTPLRAYAHEVPRCHIQNFGSAVSHLDTNEYAVFLQDTVRVAGRRASSLGVRYDLQTFSTKDLVTNPLWPRAWQSSLQQSQRFATGRTCLLDW